MFASTGIVGVTAALLLSSGAVTKPAVLPPPVGVASAGAVRAGRPAVPIRDGDAVRRRRRRCRGADPTAAHRNDDRQYGQRRSVTSGAVNFSDNALSGFRGIGNFVVNTGANNTLQGAINISVVTTPGP